MQTGTPPEVKPHFIFSLFDKKKNTQYFSLGKTKKLATLAYLLSKIRTQMGFQYRHYVSYKRNHTFLHPLFITT